MPGTPVNAPAGIWYRGQRPISPNMGPLPAPSPATYPLREARTDVPLALRHHTYATVIVVPWEEHSSYCAKGDARGRALTAAL